MAKDAKGHGSNTRGGKVQVSVDPSKLGHRIADIGAGGSEHNVQTGGAWAAQELARGNPHAAPAPVHGGASGRSLAAGLHKDWSASGNNPYTGGGFAAQSRARRLDKASSYVKDRAGRSSNFKFGR